MTEDAETTHYAVGPAGHVTAVAGPASEETYTYDLAGNQTAAHWTAPHTSGEATGDHAYSGSLLTRAGRIGYRHDAAGRVVLTSPRAPT
ncbi:hypothetical protein E1265_24975 [Streptomyces sp. 8K308]|nr:hypothetical protein E1265_24975 [Streptomyces sp. 8K308]